MLNEVCVTYRSVLMRVSHCLLVRILMLNEVCVTYRSVLMRVSHCLLVCVLMRVTMTVD